MKKDKKYYLVDHADKHRDRLRTNPNRASLRRATQRQAAASIDPPGAADSAKKSPKGSR